MGRKKILKTISALFKNSPLKIAALYGPTGFGKSQIAKHYAYLHYPAYDVVWWFKGGEYLEPQFEEFALEVSAHMKLGLDEKIKSIGHERLINIIKNTIRRKRLKCLLIFDDVPTYKDIESYIPFSHEKNVHVLITTKNANFSVDAIQVKPFEREESIAYINLFLPQEGKDNKDKLASHMADSPSSLGLALDYIKEYPGMSIEDYIHQHAQENPLSDQAISIAAERLGGPIDTYEKDQFKAIKMHLDELKRNSNEAFQLIEFLSLLNHNEINIVHIQDWIKIRKMNVDISDLLKAINKFSFIETTTIKEKKKVYMSMHELIQKIISTFVSPDEKKQLIEETSLILLKSFSGRSDQNAENTLKDRAPLLHAIKISEEANRLDYHSPTLASLRARIFDVLVCGIRDPEKAKIVSSRIQADLDKGVLLSATDKILYTITQSVLSALQSPDYTKALDYGHEASFLLEKEEGLYEEKIRLIANLIQYNALLGNLDECEKLVKKGEAFLPLSKSEAYNSLFIFATTLYLIDKGELQRTVDLIAHYHTLIEGLNLYPSIRFYILNQLAEAFLKQGHLEKCQQILKKSEKDATEFYTNKKNTFFAHLDVMKASCSFPKSKDFKNSEALIRNSLKTYVEVVGGEDKHRNQAFAHLMLGKLYALNKHYDQAKEQFLASEQIFEKLLKNKKIDDVSELYKSLAILGANSQNEALTHQYLEKHKSLFGVNHPKTRDIILYLDEKKLKLPFN